MNVTHHASCCCSAHSLESDHLIAFITASLAGANTFSQAAIHSQATDGTAATTGTGRSSLTAGSVGGVSAGSSGLSPNVQQWQVEWDAITLERAIGKGSYGNVFLASWRQTPVACKILISAKGWWGSCRLGPA